MRLNNQCKIPVKGTFLTYSRESKEWLKENERRRRIRVPDPVELFRPLCSSCNEEQGTVVEEDLTYILSFSLAAIWRVV